MPPLLPCGASGDAAETRREQAYDLWLACYTQQEIAEQTGIPQRTVAHMVEDFTQIGNLSKMGKNAAEFGSYDPPLYNVWKRKVKSEGVDHPGNSEPEIVERLLYMYTDPFGVVVDPFAGGGSALPPDERQSDENRRCQGLTARDSP